uniref:Thionin-2.2 n=2 Tax=Noccaea caerulescens TaxID=107243 RepID=A0A1J3JKZ0_NOCCA
MEYKTVILSLIVMSCVMAQIRVEAKVCCPTTAARDTFIGCRINMRNEPACALSSGCKMIPDVLSCPQGYNNDILGNSGGAANAYCKLGCVSSVCGALTTLQNSDANEIVNGAVEQCTKACSAFCTKGFKTALETA